jgi:hypothetical protein
MNLGGCVRALLLATLSIMKGNELHAASGRQYPFTTATIPLHNTIVLDCTSMRTASALGRGFAIISSTFGLWSRFCSATTQRRRRVGNMKGCVGNMKGCVELDEHLNPPNLK